MVNRECVFGDKEDLIENIPNGNECTDVRCWATDQGIGAGARWSRKTPQWGKRECILDAQRGCTPPVPNKENLNWKCWRVMGGKFRCCKVGCWTESERNGRLRNRPLCTKHTRTCRAKTKRNFTSYYGFTISYYGFTIVTGVMVITNIKT